MQTAEISRIVRPALLGIGYASELIHNDYTFADVFADQPEAVSVACFGNRPASYRYACLAFDSDRGGGAAAVSRMRALGAPQVFTVGAHSTLRWQMRAQGEPTLLETISTRSLPAQIRLHSREWGPDAILRAKALVGQPPRRQLDFFDVGLLPTIEGVARRKLHELLSDVLEAATSDYKREAGRRPKEQELFRLAFRLVAAKVFMDRGQIGTFGTADAALAAMEQRYYAKSHIPPALEGDRTRAEAWRRISRVAFSNISLETLAHVYENTLVSNELRRKHGIHGTPSEIADFVVQRLPYDHLPLRRRRTFEPCSGHGVFLVAVLRRLRDLLPPGFPEDQRHAYLTSQLVGLERDSFANEVARLSLMLADYPNPNGWRIEDGDVFASDAAGTFASADAVVCNPPFEDFTPSDKAAYQDLTSANKSAEVLSRALAGSPKLLAFVLPRRFLDGKAFREMRAQVLAKYATSEVYELPDSAFVHSGAESVVLVAHGERGKSRPHRRAAVAISKAAYPRALSEPISLVFRDVTDESDVGTSQLAEVWAELGARTKLGAVAEIHRGIEYNEADDGGHYSHSPRRGFVPGVWSVQVSGFEPYWLDCPTYIAFSDSHARGQAHRLPWNNPKVIVNAARLSRGPWRLAGVPDRAGLVCYQNFHGVWPRDPAGPSLELLSAIISGPVANAYLHVRKGGKHNQVSALADLPLPVLSDALDKKVTALVRQFGKFRRRQAPDPDQLRTIMIEIDAAVLEGYGLPVSIERRLLDFFAGETRQGVGGSFVFLPPDFRPLLPLAFATPARLRASEGPALLERIVPIDDAELAVALEGALGGDDSD